MQLGMRSYSGSRSAGMSGIPRGGAREACRVPRSVVRCAAGRRRDSCPLYTLMNALKMKED